MFPQEQGDRIFLKDSTPEPGFLENIDEAPVQVSQNFWGWRPANRMAEVNVLIHL